MSRIEWTDVTWNPLVGCGKVSPGCKHCYAEVMGKRLRAMALADVEAGRDPGRKRAYVDAVDEMGRWTGRVVTSPEALFEPLRWRAPRRVFVNSMSDLFHADVPDEFVAAVFGVMAACPQHTFQVLTKRAARLPQFFGWLAAQHPDARTHAVWEALRHEALHVGDDGPLHTRRCASPAGPWPLPNVWVGVSVEDQTTADERIPHLLGTPAAVRFVSYEPALGPAELGAWLRQRWECRCTPGCGDDDERPDNDGCPMCTTCGLKLGGDPRSMLDWVIVGGESGSGARPFDVAWGRRVVSQCRAAGVACFVKQFGEVVVDSAASDAAGLPEPWPSGTKSRAAFPVGIVLRDRKGGNPAEWPEDLRVRQWPAEASR